MSTIPQAFRWQLEGSDLPPLPAALRVATATRAAIYRGADARGLLPLPDKFHTGTNHEHSHAYWLAEDADDDGHIDHVLLFAASGLPRTLLPVLAESWRIELAGLGRWRLSPNWMGQQAPGALFGPACFWTSATAYVTPLLRERKRTDGTSELLDATAQLRWEIGMRRFDAKVREISISPSLSRGHKAFRASDFSLKARKHVQHGGVQSVPEHWSPPKDAERVAVKLQFDRPVWGPLAFGYGAHFGLGLFEPMDSAIAEA